MVLCHGESQTEMAGHQWCNMMYVSICSKVNFRKDEISLRITLLSYLPEKSMPHECMQMSNRTRIHRMTHTSFPSFCFSWSAYSFAHSFSSWTAVKFSTFWSFILLWWSRMKMHKYRLENKWMGEERGERCIIPICTPDVIFPSVLPRLPASYSLHEDCCLNINSVSCSLHSWPLNKREGGERETKDWDPRLMNPHSLSSMPSTGSSDAREEKEANLSCVSSLIFLSFTIPHSNPTSTFLYTHCTESMSGEREDWIKFTGMMWESEQTDTKKNPKKSS